ncbi:hypothetical protein [Paenibacillus polysaccharolyticus]|uniref:hypothetical protein n=1 Tax=Paenibacillus polysaccharolyticus TaxID=582692 RepID=UPI00280BF52E|nr:hypothetical protein [Paenibacillus polysaccharolyticus]
MSTSISIEIFLSEKISGMAILNKLEKYGWTYNDHGNVAFLLIGDNDNYDWQRTSISKEKLLGILSEKEKSGELIGVVMTWEDTNIGGTFLIRNNGTFLMSPDINRRFIDIEGYNKVTDLNWYMTKLLPIFSSLLESFSYQEHV